jgi:trans-aconitate methyltransferase
VVSSTTDAYFDEMWAAGDDPWAHGRRWYEARKYDLTVACLPAERYRSAFEPGCGAGFLTERLAGRVDRLVAMERAERGVEATRRRCAGLPHVEVRRGRIPSDWPEGTFELLVLSEVLYYLDDDELAAVLTRAATGLAPGGDLVAVHYRVEVAEHARPGDEVHAALRQTFGSPAVTHLEEAFVLEVFGAARGR